MLAKRATKRFPFHIRWHPTCQTQSRNNSIGIFDFFALPLEIRIEIYNHALVPTLPETKVRLPACEGQGQNHQVKEILQLLRALWSVSKQMYSETLTHFLEHNHIHWHGNLTTTAWINFQHLALPHVKRLSISISDYQLCWMEQSKLRETLKRMHRCSKVADEQNPWKLQHLGLLVRNDYLDLDRDDQVWFHWRNVDESRMAAPAGSGQLPDIQGLQRLSITTPWKVGQDWKDRFVEEAGAACVVEFGSNYDRTVPKPRKGPWRREGRR